MIKLLEQMLALIEQDSKSALCSVLARSGSVPAPAGSRLLVRPDGTIAGTVGGGALEGQVTSDAREAIASGAPVTREFDFGGPKTNESLQICGGRITIYTEVVYPTGSERDLTESTLQEIKNGRSVALATAVMSSYPVTPPTGHRMAFNRQGILAGGLVETGLSELVMTEALPLFDGADPLFLEVDGALGRFPHLKGFLVDFIHPAPVLVVFGGGHIGRPLANLGALCGFRVIVADDRAEFASPQRFPDADQILTGKYAEIIEQLEIGPRHYLVSVTRCHTTDSQVIEHAAATPAAYIGMIGSKRKIGMIWRDLEQKGISREHLERVHTPVGVDIDAETPEEIAVSIIAQIIAVRRSHRPVIHHGKLSL